MTAQRITTKAELLADIEQQWRALNAVLERLSDVQWTGIQDHEGWTVKDHVMHIERWERSVVFLLRGQPRHLGLGVEEALYQSWSEDEINHAIFAQTREAPLHEALAQFRDTHQRLLALLELLTNADLQQSYRRFLQGDPAEADGPPLVNLIYGNSAHHFAEHREWIEALVNRSH